MSTTNLIIEFSCPVTKKVEQDISFIITVNRYRNIEKMEQEAIVEVRKIQSDFWNVVGGYKFTGIKRLDGSYLSREVWQEARADLDAGWYYTTLANRNH